MIRAYQLRVSAYILRSDKECSSTDGEGIGEGVIAPASVGILRSAICKALQSMFLQYVFAYVF